MGRPIKKKFFANLNAPYQDHATGGPTGEGGEGVASVTITTTGTYVGTLPTVSFGTPDLALGTTATGVVHGMALSATVATTGTSYAYGTTLTVSGGTSVTPATFTATSLTTVSINSTPQNGGSNNDTGDRFSFSGTYGGGTWTTPLEVVVTAASGGVATGVAIYSPGVWSGTTVPTNTIGATRTQTYGSIDMNGTNLQVTLTDWGVAAVTLANGGDYTAVPANSVSTTGGGGNAKLNVTYGVKSVAITNAGSHYFNEADASVTFSSGTAAGTSVLTNLYQAGLAVYVNIIDGTEGALADIMKQEASRRYLVKTRDDNGKVGQCRLVARDPGDLYPGEMCLIATDTEGCTYFVTKLTAHRAYLVQRSSAGAGYRFADGSSAGWSIVSASLGIVSLAHTA